jgi:hypothetical protein
MVKLNFERPFREIGCDARANYCQIAVKGEDEAL